MSADNHIEIPNMDATAKPEPEQQKRKPGRPRKVDVVATSKVSWVSAEVPLLVGEDPGYCSKYAEVRFTAPQAAKVKRMLLGLQREGVTIGQRREPIKSSADVIRYMIDRFSET